MNRRAFLTAVSGSLLAAPLAVQAQQAGKVYTVGLVSVGTDPARPVQWQPFLDTMHELGDVKGQNLAVRPAFGNGRPERLPALVAALVHAKARGPGGKRLPCRNLHRLPRRRLPDRARRTPPRTNAGRLSVAAAVGLADNKPNEENATDNAHQDNRHDDDCPGAR